jgi:hypothetical protein
VPPFGRERLEAVPGHDLAQLGAVREDLGRQIVEVVSRTRREVVVAGRHRQLLAGFQIDEREIDGRAAVVARALLRIGDVVGVLDRLPHLHGHAVGAVGVEDLHGQALGREVAIDVDERLRRRRAEERLRHRVELLVHEVVRRGVAEVEGDAERREVDHLSRVDLPRDVRAGRAGDERDEQEQPFHAAMISIRARRPRKLRTQNANAE